MITPTQTTQQKPYTVMLLYPGYMCDGDVETYLTTVYANDVAAAQQAAKVELVSNFEYVPSVVHPDDTSEMPTPDEFTVLMVLAGAHQDIQNGLA